MLFDLSPLIKWGVGGLATVAPITYASASRTSWEKLWVKRISSSGPILSCTVNNSGGGDKTSFDIFLALKGENSGLSSEDIAFRVVKKVGLNFRETVWAPDMIQKSSLGLWHLRVSTPNTIDFQYQSPNEKGYNRMNYMVASCGQKNVLLSDVRSSGLETTVPWDGIKFSLEPSKSCRQQSLKVSCKINPPTAGGHNLRWNGRFQPEIVFSPF